MTMDPFDIVSADETREHLNVDDDVPDSRIANYAKGALAHCLRYCEREDFTTPEALPDDFKIGYLLVLSDLWEHRGSQMEVQLYENRAAAAFLYPLRDLRDSTPRADGG